MDWTLEVVLVPVSDIDRAVAFYRDKVGFVLDHDTKNEHMHVVQLTPRGSGCSIVLGDLPAHREMAPGSLRGLQLVVAQRVRPVDLPAVRGRPETPEPRAELQIPAQAPRQGIREGLKAVAE